MANYNELLDETIEALGGDPPSNDNLITTKMEKIIDILEDGSASGSSGIPDNNYIKKDVGTDSDWWSEKSTLQTGVNSAVESNGTVYQYSQNEDGFYSPLYQACDIYQIGVLADGNTNNATAKKFNQVPHGNLQLMDGMFVAVAGGQSGNNRWHSYDGNTGGHVFEGWAKDGEQRATMLLNEPKRQDGMKEIAVFSWDRRMRDFGWTRIGCDGMYTKKSDGSYEIKDNDKEGLAVTRTFAIAHTPVQFEPMSRPVYMPEFVPNGIQTDSRRTLVPNGTTYFSEDDNLLHIKVNGKWKHFVLEDDEETEDPDIPTSNPSDSGSDSDSSGTDTPTPSEPAEGDVVFNGASYGFAKTGTFNVTQKDGNSIFTAFKWGEDEYIITSNRAIGYLSNQFRTRANIPTNVYVNGVLTNSYTASDSQQSIAWGINTNDIYANANMVRYTCDATTDDASAEVSFVKNV